jgi:4-carboxymuconolactone decarboxylase
MARIPYYDPAKAPPKLAELMGKIKPSLNIFRALANSDPVARGFVQLGNALLMRGKLSPALREIAILRTGWLSRASYEIYQHERMGRDVGLSEDKLRAIASGAQHSAFDKQEKAVLLYTDDIVHNVRASDETFKAVGAFLDTEQMVELTVVIGYYMMVSRFLETMGVDDESGQAEWRAKHFGR